MTCLKTKAILMNSYSIVLSFEPLSMAGNLAGILETCGGRIWAETADDWTNRRLLQTWSERRCVRAG